MRTPAGTEAHAVDSVADHKALSVTVLILEPSKAVSEDMLDTYLTAPSYNRGDQGFLNWYFGEHNNTGVQSLPPAYNVPAKLKVRLQL